MMKRTMALLLSLAMLFSVSACSDSTHSDETSGVTSAGANVSSESGSSQGAPEEDPVEENRALVIYFSCTGNTKAVAEEIAAQTGAELYEIVPEQPYTEEDLDYQNDNCRANQEMNDDNARPAITGTSEDFSEYGTLYIGFPIWWGTMPRIMNTFFDTYDLSGKTVMPFCTSGGSGISEAVAAIREAEPEATVQDGLQIGSGSADNCTDAVAVWLEEAGQ